LRQDPNVSSNGDARQIVAQASLRSLYLLRQRLLPDLLEELPLDAAAINALIEHHRAEWIDRCGAMAAVPHKLLLSNIAAFAVHALERHCLPAEAEAEVLQEWFGVSDSMLAGHVSKRADGAPVTYVRRYCCVRYRVRGQVKCGTCPLLDQG
jgi:ferric iron reductase protein FhuF